METAHPVKFPETVESVIGKTITVPDAAQSLFTKEKQSVRIGASFDELKQWLTEKK
jgi:threonine synthase